jgi:nicotinamidase-related amidase
MIKKNGGNVMKYLIVVDMQVDFITGSLGSELATAIVPNVVEKVKHFDGTVIFTRDTHGSDYMNTQEGKKLPVSHCIKDSDGWQICDELHPYAKILVDKPTFGSTELPRLLSERGEPIERIELCGLCTDICVISNAMLLKAAFPEVPIAVDAACSAGVTAESHETALAAMRAVQIEVI